MNEDRLNELLERCESPIERELLQNLYPHLTIMLKSCVLNTWLIIMMICR